MFDHADQPNARWKLDADGGLVLAAMRPVEAGGRLFQNYGEGNSGLLEQYGFCIEGNRLNAAEIRLPQLAPTRFEVWTRVGGEHAHKQALCVTRNCNDAAAHRLFSYLRLVCFEEPSNLPIPVGGVDKSERVAPISRRNEVAALTLLAEACQAGLREFRTSLEEDEALLKAGALPRNLHNVVMVRHDEKVILNYFLDLTKIVLPALRSCSDSKHAASEGPYAQYFAEIATMLQAECPATSNAMICSPTECTDSDEAKMHRLMEWLEEQGATFSSTVKMGAQARQLHAARRLLPGQIYMHIPKRLMITREVAKESKIGELIDQHGCKFGRYEYMAAFLMQTKREGGFWKPYVDILPREFSNQSLFFSESELEHLKGSDLFRSIAQRKADNERFYNQLPPPVKETYTLEEFTWGRCVAITRSFGVRFEGEPSVALVPLADMLDHSLHSNSRYIHESENGFILTARKRLEASSALVTTYGACSNAHLLITYGFCLEDNPHNEVDIHLHPMPDGHPFAEHTKKLGATIAGMRALKVRRSCTDDAASAVLSYLRLAHSDASLRIDNAEVQADKAGKISPISCENEITVLTALAQECARRLSEYLTSIAEDDALLKDSTLPRNVRNMVKVRRDEKVILNYWLDLTRTALPALAKDVFDVSGHTATGSVYADYFAEIGQRFGSGAECKG
jgi:histone-lysine N-methyltransferase SETD3